MSYKLSGERIMNYELWLDLFYLLLNVTLSMPTQKDLEPSEPPSSTKYLKANLLS